MKQKLCLTLALGAVLMLASCGKKLGQFSQDYFNVNPNPLEVVGEKVPATITGNIPAKFFVKNAVVTVTPVLVYNGQETTSVPYTFQGEKVRGNNPVISYENGGTVTIPAAYAYTPEMAKSTLALAFVVTQGKKQYVLPRVNVANGIIATAALADPATVNPALGKDAFQRVINEKYAADIKFLINQANIRSSELNTNAMTEFHNSLMAANGDSTRVINEINIQSYASPDGAYDFNERLAQNREDNTKGYVSGRLKKDKITEFGELTANFTAEDWEGFQKLVAKSDIEDKDLIIRVLSMYSDPAVRESEIKNMSEVYTVLKKEVLPELRRARFIANVEYQNYTAEELLQLVDENSDVLDEEALLRSASLVKDLDAKEAIYKKAIDKYNSDRAQFNLGVVYLNQGHLNKAEKAFNKVETKDADLENAKGVIALRNGDIAAAEKAFIAAGNTENQAVVDILNGKYEKAAAALKGTNSFNEALADVLTGKLAEASAALKCQCPKSNYLRAIIAARQGKAADVKDYLAKAGECKALAARAEKDIEFAQYK